MSDCGSGHVTKETGSQKGILSVFHRCIRTPENAKTTGFVFIRYFSPRVRDQGELEHHSKGHPGRQLLTSLKQGGGVVERKDLGTWYTLPRHTSSGLLPSTWLHHQQPIQLRVHQQMHQWSQLEPSRSNDLSKALHLANQPFIQELSGDIFRFLNHNRDIMHTTGYFCIHAHVLFSSSSSKLFLRRRKRND